MVRSHPPALAPLLAVSLLGALSGGIVTAQDRVLTPGRVLAMDGTPRGGATVRLIGFHQPAMFASTYDEIEVRTDDRGWFKADMLGDRCYMLWAFAPGEDVAGKPSMHCSDLVGPMLPGATYELLLPPAQHATKLRVDGLEPWAASGPFTLGIRPHLNLPPGTRLPLVDGEVELPPLPSTFAVDVLDRNGEPLVGRTMRGREDVLLVPPPVVVPMLVTSEAGKPLAGVEVRMRLGSLTSFLPGSLTSVGTQRGYSWRLVGTTDAEGRLQAAVPLAKDPFENPSNTIWFSATLDGHSESCSGWQGKQFHDFVALDKVPEDRLLRFRLTGSAPRETKLLGGGGYRWAASVVQLDARTRLQLSQNSFTTSYVSVTAPVRDGVIRWPPLPATVTDCAIRFPSGAVTAEGAPVQGPFLVVDRAGPLPEAIDLRVLRRVDLQATDCQNGPPRGARLVLVNLDTTAYDYQEICLDRAGRCSLLLAPGNWGVWTTDGVGSAAAALTVAGTDLRQTLAMEPMARLRCKFVDGEGRPVAGARLQISRTTSSSAGQIGSLERMLDRLAMTCNRNMLAERQSGPDGMLEVWFLDRERVRMGVTARVEGRGTTANFDLEPSAEVLEVRIQ